MGKPKDAADAVRMLRALSGQKHEVLTGICLKRGERLVRDIASTAVWFAPLTDDEIESYVASGEPMDKAGAYGIQGLASRFIDRIDGSYTNVVGLPVALVYRRLREFGKLMTRLFLQRRFDRRNQLARERLDGRLESLDDLSVAVHQELGEVPLDLAASPDSRAVGKNLYSGSLSRPAPRFWRTSGRSRRTSTCRRRRSPHSCPVPVRRNC